jgi:hypothetical protein
MYSKFKSKRSEKLNRYYDEHPEKKNAFLKRMEKLRISHIGRKRSPETRAKISEALRRRTPEQKRAGVAKAHAKVRELAAAGLWKPCLGKSHHNNTKEKSEKARLAAEARRGLNNPVFRVINGKTNKDRMREAFARNGTSFKGKNNPAYGKVYGGGIKRCWHILSNGRRISFRSTWEAAFAHYLEALSVEYEYESQIFKFEQFTYTPDFYLPNIDLWIEIKGFIRDDDLEKIEALRGLGKRLLVINDGIYSDLNLAAFRSKALCEDREIYLKLKGCEQLTFSFV